MRKRTWWKRLVSRKPQAPIQRRSRWLCPEQLEDRCQPSVVPVGVYSPIDEVGNNVANPDWGAAPADQPGGAAIQLLRLSPTAYTDGVSTPSLTYAKVNGVDTIPSPRTISNDVFNQSPSLFGSPSTDINTVDGNGLSDFGYSFGQFMDHDMDLTPDQGGLPVPPGDAAANKDGNDGFPIPVDATNPGDPIGSLAFSRSVFDPTTETSVSITGASWANGVATITAANTFTPGQLVAINGVVPAGYNSPGATFVNGVITPAAPFTILSANGSSFTYALATNPGTVTNFTGAAASTGLRQQTNVITSYLDLSQVYGSSQTVSNALRTFSGGLLKTSPGNMLPYDNTNYFTPDQITALNMADSGPLPESSIYAAGDVRANENTELTSLTTLFVRNHNEIATQLATQNPVLYGFTSWNDENLYQEARKLNIAEYQNIIYTQYLPALLGPDAPAYTGYNPTVNASIATEFSTVAFRFGHSMLNNTVERDANNGSSVGNVPLAVDFFDPNLVNPSGAIDPFTGLAGTDIGAYLKGDADSSSQADDAMAVSSVRDDLFETGTGQTAGGEDLISRDIWRARDDGIGNYNQVRVAFGLPAITDDATFGFDQITSNVTVQHELETAYAGLIAQGGNAGDIDPFVAGMAEDHLPGSDMGPLFTAVLVNQFSRLENGDQFFYLNESFTYPELGILQQGTTLGQIITTNTGVTNLQSNVFIAPGQVADHGFETPSVGAGTYYSFAYNPTGAPWTFSGSAGIAGNGSGFTSGNPNAPEGVQVAFLQETGSFSQTIDLQAGTYSLTFLAAQRGNWNQGGQTFEVLVDGANVGVFTPSSADYLAFQSANFTATAGSHTLSFVGLDPAGGDNTAFVDDVQVAAPSAAQTGSFDSPNVGSGTYQSFQYDPTGSAWAFTSSAGVAGNDSGFTSGNPNAPVGAQVAFLQETGSMSTVVNLATAGTFDLSFYAAQRGNWNQGGQTFAVYANGVLVGTFTPSSSEYELYQTSFFSAAAGPLTITFVGLDPLGGDNTAFIDNVLVN